ncbi:MAG: Gfo/Idh/MocA family oxidoreductase [Acidimicrobiia bacterium]|nr:Gfo/Idh/MocA family oxidoreductase [Acidimicrobiia bacterium]
MTDRPSVAVVGSGYWGRNLVRNFAELGALAAVSDVEPGRAAVAAEEHGASALSVDEALAAPGIDAVVIAAPAARHYELAAKSLAAGKHVYVEKPLALDLSEAESLCAQAAAAGRTLMVGHLLQYHPAFLKLKELADDGALGRLQYLYSNRLNLGRIRREEDILWSFAPHDISMILSIVKQEPDSVTAVGAPYLHKSIADVTTTHLTFPGGERAHVFVSWLHPFKEQKLVVVGDRGMALFDDGEPWSHKVQIYRHRIDWKDGLPQVVKAAAEPIPLDPVEPLRVECQHFLSCVATGATPRTDGYEGLRVLRVLKAAGDAMAVTPRPPVPSATARFPRVTIHESAYIDDGCDIGSGTRIWHFTHVLRGSRIGRNCTLGQNVTVGPDVTIGDDCKLQNNVSVYRGVTLEDGVFCGPSCVFTNVVNPRAEVERKDEFKPTPVGRGATIGANATVVCGNAIGEYAMVGAGAVVTTDVPAHALVVGVPAHRIGWVSDTGERLGPDLVCPRSGKAYEEVDGELLERR